MSQIVGADHRKPVVLGGTGASGWITDYGGFAVILPESGLLHYLRRLLVG
jgi:hypothetical protein